MRVKKIYQEFEGYIENCLREKCEFSQCEKASRQGVEIFPDEVDFLMKEFKFRPPVKIYFKKNSSTGFIMKHCSRNKKCLLKEKRPIFCRTFPVKPFFMNNKHFKISVFDACPVAYNLPEDFSAQAMQVWSRAMKKRNRNLFKKLFIFFRYRRWIDFF